MKRYAPFAIALVALLAVAGGWLALRPPGLEVRLYQHGVARGRADAAAGIHRPEDVSDRQIALQYLDMPLDPRPGQDADTPMLTKAVLDAPAADQPRLLDEFARGYRKGYAQAQLAGGSK